MKELADRGAILGQFGKQPGKQAYEAEIKLRGLAPKDDAVPPQANGTEGTGTKVSLSQGDTTIRSSRKAVRLPP